MKKPGKQDNDSALVLPSDKRQDFQKQINSMDDKLKKLEQLEDDIKVCNDLIKSLQEQKKNAEKRRTALVDSVISEMQEDGVVNQEYNNALWSIKRVPPKPIITSAECVPKEFWKQKLEIDKAKINAAYKLGKTVSGCVMDNGGYTLQKRSTI